MWTTYNNLNNWFDSWELFCIANGFAELKPECSEDNSTRMLFSEEQKCRIINMDETKLSLDGFNGGIGGHPACTITVKCFSCPGTACNKPSSSSTFMCGSKAAGEPIPMHIMFLSDAQDDESIQENEEWISNLPRVFV